MYLDKIKKIKDLDFKNKKVLLRTDFNVPLDKNGSIQDDFRIKESLKTIKHLFSKGASQVIIMSHLGRPQGFDKKYSMNVIRDKLIKLTAKRIVKLDTLVDLEEIMPNSAEAKIVLLENLRFYEGEQNNDDDFAKSLSKVADVYVNDAFGVCHRKHSSVHAITRYLPSCIGLLVEKELSIFENMLESPNRPFYAIIGGSKLETKIPVIQNLVHKVDKLFLGGGMIFTFYKVQGYSIGKSLYDKNNKVMAKMMLNNEKIILPKDVIIADDKDEPSQFLSVTIDKIPSYMMGLDIGDESLSYMIKEMKDAETIVWNGPIGYYENPLFAKATITLLKELAKSKAKVIIGGGDTSFIVERLNLKNDFYHVSTGGGASLKLLEGTGLVALDVLIK